MKEWKSIIYISLAMGATALLIGYMFYTLLLADSQKRTSSKEELERSTYRTVMEQAYPDKDTVILFDFIDTTLYNKAPWWPGFREMVLPSFGPELTIVRVDSTENRYIVYYADGPTWGYYESCK